MDTPNISEEEEKGRKQISQVNLMKDKVSPYWPIGRKGPSCIVQGRDLSLFWPFFYIQYMSKIVNKYPLTFKEDGYPVR
jgi:hypothetical protein